MIRHLLGFTHVEAPVAAVAAVADLGVRQAGEARQPGPLAALEALQLPLAVLVGPEDQMLALRAEALQVDFQFWILSAAAPALLRLERGR